MLGMTEPSTLRGMQGRSRTWSVGLLVGNTFMVGLVTRDCLWEDMMVMAMGVLAGNSFFVRVGARDCLEVILSR